MMFIKKTLLCLSITGSIAATENNQNPGDIASKYNDMRDNHQKLCKLRKYANERLKKLYSWDPHYMVDAYLSSVIEETRTEKFDSRLSEAKAAIEDDINFFIRCKEGSLDVIETWEKVEQLHCSHLNSVEKTWLQFKTCLTSGRELGKHPWHERTAYQLCSRDLSGIKYWKEYKAKIEQQIKVLQKIKFRLDECISAEKAPKE